MKCVSCPNTDKNCKIFIELKHNEYYICENCIKKVTKAYNKHLNNKPAVKEVSSETIPSSKKIVAYLDKFIISQDEAKKTLAIAVRNHYKRILMDDDDKNSVEKSNILIMGESGTGKTAIIKKIAEFIDVPMVIADSSSITSNGYVGEDVESVINQLYEMAGRDIEKAEKGIVFFDEIDKKKKSKDNGRSKDVTGESVQTAMLKLVEGKMVKVDKEKFIDTRNILFIAGGAFVDLKTIIGKRTANGNLGFLDLDTDNANKIDDLKMESIYSNTTVDDLVEYGLIPELIGRFPVHTYTNSLTKENMKRIIVEPYDSILSQFKKLFKVDDITLHFSNDAIEYIADKVVSQKIGVRGVRKVFEEILKDVQYDIEDYKANNVNRISFYMDKNQELKKRFTYKKVKTDKSKKATN